MLLDEKKIDRRITIPMKINRSFWNHFKKNTGIEVKNNELVISFDSYIDAVRCQSRLMEADLLLKEQEEEK